jgi:LmbE family N-acetylglucosaminyl deacetylase
MDKKMNKMLFVGAHYDDIEISAGGTVARFVKEGNEVYAIVVSSSEYTDYNGKILRTLDEATVEGMSGLLSLGVKSVINLGFDAKNIPFNSDLIEKLNKYIDLFKPDLIITHHPYAESHPAHLNTAKSVLAAARYQNNIWCFEPLYPSNQSTVPFKPQKYVDITEFMPKKLKSLMAHDSQWKKYSYWEDLVLSLGRLRGIEIGVRYAESFEVIKEKI